VLFCVQTLHGSYDNRAVIVYKLCANRSSSYGGVRFLCSICARNFVFNYHILCEYITMVFKSYPIRQKTQIRLICAHTIVLFCVQTLQCSYDNCAVIVYKLCANCPSSYGGVRFLCSI
jgi:hypothetical protein